MGDGYRSAWFGAGGFEILGVTDEGAVVTVEVETTATQVWCGECGVRAWSKDRRWVTLADVH